MRATGSNQAHDHDHAEHEQGNRISIEYGLEGFEEGDEFDVFLGCPNQSYGQTRTEDVGDEKYRQIGRNAFNQAERERKHE